MYTIYRDFDSINNADKVTLFKEYLTIKTEYMGIIKLF